MGDLSMRARLLTAMMTTQGRSMGCLVGVEQLVGLAFGAHRAGSAQRIAEFSQTPPRPRRPQRWLAFIPLCEIFENEISWLLAVAGSLC